METWKDVEARNRGIDAGVPKHGAAHVERGERIREQVYQRMESRIAEHQKERPINPSTNPLPSLGNAPKLALPASLKKQG